jgi:hypothetical protein
MNERQEKTSDILGKLTVLGTIVLPMNVVTGIWGMNWYVPNAFGVQRQSLTRIKHSTRSRRREPQLVLCNYWRIGGLWYSLLRYCEAGVWHRLNMGAYWRIFGVEIDSILGVGKLLVVYRPMEGILDVRLYLDCCA